MKATDAHLRDAITKLRDAARVGGLDFRQRDPLVVMLHDAITELQELRDTSSSPSETPIRALRDEWRSRARALGQGDHDAAVILNDCAAELDAALAGHPQGEK